ncbi:MAG TPA: hypothetical protein PK059_12375, partial [Cyclobacteriaceae bacterium]|nr:hypothetical protein [Cyclobacteriaceae bacterium]
MDTSPMDGTVYAASASFGSGSQLGTGNYAILSGTGSVSLTGLSPNTTYYFQAFEYNGTGTSRNYNTYYSALNGNPINITTLYSEPTVQASNIVFNPVASNSITLTWTNGNGSEHLVVARQGSSVSVDPLDGSSYTGNADFSVATDLGSGNKVVYRGSANSASITNLNATTTYYFKVYELNGAGVLSNYLTSSATGNPASISTLYNEPNVQTTNVITTSLMSNSLDIGWTSGNGTERLVVVRQGGAVNVDPVDGISYSGNTDFAAATDLGSGNKVVYRGSYNFASIMNLTANTIYYIRVYELNGTGSLTNYLTATATGNPVSVNTIYGEPTVQTSNLTITSFTTNSITLSWANGNGTERMVIARQGAPIMTSLVQDGQSYSGNSDFVAATDIGSGQKVVFRGSGSSVTVTNLMPNSAYYFNVLELNGVGILTNYLTTVAAGNSTTRSTLEIEPTAQPTGLAFSNQSVTGLTLNFTAATGSPTGYLIIRNAGAPSSGIPSDGSYYNVGGPLNGVIVSNDNSTTINDTGLSPGTVYYYTIFSFNGTGTAINYLTSAPGSTASSITLCVAPTAQQASLVNQTSFTSNWSTVTGASNYLLDVAAVGDFSSFVSGYNGKTVTINSDVVTGLSAGTTYYYRVRAVNGISMSSANSGTISQITVPPKPSGVGITGVSQIQFTVTWSSSTGAVDYLLDISSDNFVTFVSGYNSKVLSGTVENVNVGLLAGNTYQVRIRARNAGGTSPDYGSASQLLLPETPVAMDADPIGFTSFTAKWVVANGAASYVIDVSALSNFTTHLSGYPKDVGTATEELVTSLTQNTSYYYRIKAVNATGESPYSIPKPVQTSTQPAGSALAFGSITYADLPSDQTTAPVSAEVTGGTGAKTVVLSYRKITSTGSLNLVSMTNTSGNNYSSQIPASALDELGVEFTIVATDASGNPPVTSPTKYLYRSFTSQTAQALPSIVRFGGTVQSYQIISIPFDLGVNNNISDVFDPVLGGYDKTKWRFVRYQNDKNTDYQEGISKLELGKSYWFNSLSSVTIKPSAGTTPKYNQSSPFQLSLAQGWNQIATPYPFAIDWDDVQVANGSPAGVGKYKIFNSGELGFNESNSLAPYEGGFVFADNATTLNVPVLLR